MTPDGGVDVAVFLIGEIGRQSAILGALVGGMTEAVKRAVDARWDGVGSRYAPAIAMLTGLVLNCVIAFAGGARNPEAYVVAAVIGIGVGGVASGVYKQIKEIAGASKKPVPVRPAATKKGRAPKAND